MAERVPVDPDEEIVFRLFRRSFLSLWSYANPRGKEVGKELCDTLVVCDPDIVIVSVKAPRLLDTGDAETNVDRWRRRAIDESVEQIYGAERWVRQAPRVIRSDGSEGLPLPPVSERRIHRVAVAVGGRRQVLIESRDFGKGFVHVFDEPSLTAVLAELDTVTDFVSYLTAKEELYQSGVLVEFAGGEEDLLALYLHRGRQFSLPATGKVKLPDSLWKDFICKDEYKAKKEADKISYAWDRLVSHIGDHALVGTLEFGSCLTGDEIVLRVMAKEHRFARRILAAGFLDFLNRSNKIESRMCVSPSGIVYVFLAMPYDTDRRIRLVSLGSRCFVARGQNPNSSIVIGIATERHDPSRLGCTFDVHYLRIETWTAQHQVHMEGVQKDFGYFTNPQTSMVRKDEYPRG